VLQMLAAIHHAPVAAADIEELRARMPTIPTRPDVPSGLKQLKEAGFRLATCANSPPIPRRAAQYRAFRIMRRRSVTAAQVGGENRCPAWANPGGSAGSCRPMPPAMSR
jgi:hypothetical protein